MRKLWNWIGHALTFRDVIILLGAISLGGFSVWLATANQIFELFAPWSYLISGLITFILSAIFLNLALTAYQRLTGWKPKPRVKRLRLPPRDAPMGDVVLHMREHSLWGRGIRGRAAGAQNSAISQAILDAVSERLMHVWARNGLGHMELIPLHAWPNVVVQSHNLSLEVIPHHPLADVSVRHDVYFNWREVRAAWPKPRFWQRESSIS